MTDHDVLITWPGCSARKPNNGYDPTSCDNGKRLVRRLRPVCVCWEALHLSEERPACVRVVPGCGGQDVEKPTWARFALLGAVGTVFTFAANGHEEKYTVTNDSAQTIFITAGMVLEDSALQSKPEPEQPSAVVRPDRLEECATNMTLVKVGSLCCRCKATLDCF